MNPKTRSTSHASDFRSSEHTFDQIRERAMINQFEKMLFFVQLNIFFLVS